MFGRNYMKRIMHCFTLFSNLPIHADVALAEVVKSSERLRSHQRCVHPGMHVRTVGLSTGVEFLYIFAGHGCAFIDAIRCGLSNGSGQVVADGHSLPAVISWLNLQLLPNLQNPLLTMLKHGMAAEVLLFDRAKPGLRTDFPCRAAASGRWLRQRISSSKFSLWP